jgi:O-methyltransferase
VIKRIVRGCFRRLGYDIVARRNGESVATIARCNDELEPKHLVGDGSEIRDSEFYTPLFSPWNGYGTFADYYRLASPYTLVSADRCWLLYKLALQCLNLPGDFWECGVYKGGTARMLAQILYDSPAAGRLHLFDTFAGMPATDPARDWHRAGDFSDTSVDAVRAHVGNDEIVRYHPGVIPRSFAGSESATISFAHIDVDIYQAVKHCCHFILPRLVVGGIMVFDDYGFPTCPGARQAVDEFFSGTPFVPLVVPTGQAVLFKNAEWKGACHAAVLTQPNHSISLP